MKQFLSGVMLGVIVMGVFVYLDNKDNISVKMPDGYYQCKRVK